MDLDVLQSTLDDLCHLLIHPPQLTLEGSAEIGVGGYGRVFLAVLESSGSQIKVAVKQLRIVQPIDDRRRIATRLARELKVWAKAKHPNILELLGFYHSDDYLCAQFVSAYMANGNVKEYIGRLQPNVTVATRLRFVQGITSGMSYLHDCNPAICHGDLKPTNVLVDNSLNVVLCDFGLATFIVESEVPSGLTTSKTPKGSIRYMSPELLLESGAKYTLKSDVWAWACTAFEILTDREPFLDAKLEGAVIAAIALERPPGSVDLFDGLGSDGHITYRLALNSLKSIIPDCWDRNSAKRPSSSEILNRLISSDAIEASDTATGSSHLSATEDHQPELFPPSDANSPTHGNFEEKRKGSPMLEGRLEKGVRGKDAAIETGTHDILQLTLDDLSHLIIPPERLTLEDDVELGVGCYGEFGLAVLRDSDLQIKVAVKQLIIVQPEGVRRRLAIGLARELKVWAAAKHPNILELLGFHLSDNYGCVQLVSAYMANGNVKDYINRLQPNLATRLRFVQGITSGISYLHNCDPAICHGDLKPTHVLVTESLDAVLCGFNLARFISEAGVPSGLTTSKSVKGTTRYMAPELLLGGEAKHTLESDVWAWACTAFEVLTGRQPFSDAKREQVVVTAAILGRPPGSVDLLDSLVSDGNMTYHLTLDSLKSIIRDCWIGDSAKRPSSSEILDRLVSPDGIEALDTATASSHLSATDDRQLEPFPPPSTDLPMHTDVKKKRKGSPGLEGRLEKRARGEAAAIEIEAVRM